MTRLARALLAGPALILAAACSVPAGRDPFSEGGEVIAMGGGRAGARGACFTCHGLGGEGDGGAAPRLAGLGLGYLQKQMEDFATGRRPDEVMSPIARALGPEARAQVSGFYAAMAAPKAPGPGTGQGAAAALYHRGDPARGLQACADCHGPSGEGAGPANPPLAGQPAPYLAEQLRRWKAAQRRNDPRGVMTAVSQRLSRAEIQALADYLATPSASPAPAG